MFRAFRAFIQPSESMQVPDTLPTNESLLAICLFAAFADGDKSDQERGHIESLALELGGGDVSAVSRRILMGRLSIDAAAAELKTRDERMLGYEMARAVCEANGSISADEQAFLNDLRAKLALGEAEAKTLDDEVDSLALAPLDAGEPATAAADSNGMILRYSILNGALELLPETLATMAILPLQMKMVWRIGKVHGFELDRSSIKEFLATAGIGFGSQVIEGFARKLIGGVGQKTRRQTRRPDRQRGDGLRVFLCLHLCHWPARREILRWRPQTRPGRNESSLHPIGSRRGPTPC